MFDYAPVAMQPGSTSYFSDPESHLDPALFDGMHLRPHVRDWITHTVLGFLDQHYLMSDHWTRLWIAGSGVSYQWAADRDPGDLDVMLGIDYTAFRQAHPGYYGVPDSQIAAELNEILHGDLYPEISGVNFGRSNFEVTVFVNAGVGAQPDGILAINPYAAYDVTQDEWAVLPDPNPRVHAHPTWMAAVESDRARGERIVRAYNDTVARIRGASNSPARVNAEHDLSVVLRAAAGLFDEVHTGRKAAFGSGGAGYADYANFRWQAGKRSGVIPAMKRLRDYDRDNRVRDDFETYGMELPDTETLIRRAMAAYRG